MRFIKLHLKRERKIDMDKKALNHLRFKELINYGLQDDEIENYKYLKQNFENIDKEKIREPICCCNFCGSKIESEIEFGNMLHGTTSEDYFSYLTDMNLERDWNETPVMFVFENPGASPHDGFVSLKGHQVIAKTWPYIGWTNKDKTPKDKANDFCFKEELESPRRYGEMICATILEYNLKNAYVTNLVKCGFRNNKNLNSQNEVSSQMIKHCMDHIFLKEFQAVSPEIIFAFGNKTYSTLQGYRDQLGVEIKQLYHPAARIKKEKRLDRSLKIFNECFPGKTILVKNDICY